MDKIDEVLNKLVANIIPGKKELEKVLRSGKKLNVYLGIDPTFTRIHLGNAVPLRKLQAFAELGHNVTFLIGDFTALIGDTSDKESERPVLTSAQIENNFQTYKKQASKILDFSKVNIRHNSEWLKKLGFDDVVKLTRNFSLNDFISRELIKRRLSMASSVSLPEVLYPVMQGYDSYFMDTDIQVGGTDQVFNMQAGRTLQKKLRGKESFVLETKFPLEGTDGRKMSKSWGNAIWLDDAPNDVFGKVMSLKDELIPKYFEMATNTSLEKLGEVTSGLSSGKNPINFKKELALTIVSELHSKEAALKAQKSFEQTFQERAPEFNIKVQAGESLLKTIIPFTNRQSASAAKELIKQGAVDINGEKVTDGSVTLKVGDEIKVGERTFLKVSK
jgi:tyrosyl-tRNA synthetase